MDQIMSSSIIQFVSRNHVLKRKMQVWTTKVDSIGTRLGSENEFDGVTSCTSVESSGESHVGLLDSENGAILDRHNVGADELATAVADAQVCTEAMRALGESKSKMWTFIGGGHEKRREIQKGILGHIEIQRFKKCGLGGEMLTS
jgi:hypothetical protein